MKESDEMCPSFMWEFLAYEHKRSQMVSFYDFIMFGLIKRRTEIVRWDHPGRKLVRDYFRNDEVRSKKNG